MPVPSLYEIARKRIITNISLLTDIGDLPYSFLAPVLKHIQNPSQLLELETTCPQLLGETGEIWLRFIKRDIPNWDRKPHQPRNPENWSKVYRKLKRDAEREQEEQEEALREQMRALQKDRSENKTTIVNASVNYNPAVRRRGAGGSSSWGTSTGPPPPPKTGKAVLDKLKRGMFDQKMARPKATHIPAHLLEERRGKVAQAPERLLRLNEGEPKSASMNVPRRSSQSVLGLRNPHPVVQRRAQTSPQPQPQPSSSSSSATPQTKLVRTSLPADKHFSAPKLHAPSTTGAAPQKRKREEANPFMPKKRKV
ncbi:RNA polymerase II transcription factor SIII subunit A-domain-containing protein [Clohesyomyces aquaticus]|uniref:RNA polymerase II transcription factor SIII subunit A-domain-containing protein n=1 Tax=Clohesyomyces aquaticus TaxID=1231657 RepID=A0A1Y2A0C8_9PLEO|nr:RNA polymerase II transcription factor SIII subunit A-domain-containing protein [Clohesyomyces aquaticus]